MYNGEKSSYCIVSEKPDFDDGLILRRGCTAEHVVSKIEKILCEDQYITYRIFEIQKFAEFLRFRKMEMC